MRLLYTGIAGGLITSLCLTLPLYLVLPTMFTPAWPNTPVQIGLVGLALAVLTTVVSGYVGARWSWSGSFGACLLRGAIAGAIVGTLAWVIIGSAAAGVVAHAPIWSHGPHKADTENQMLILLGEAVVRTSWLDLISLGVSSIAGLVLGAFGGMWYSMHRAPGWDIAPRPTHRTIVQAMATTFLYLSATATVICIAIWKALPPRLDDVRSKTGHTFSLPPWGIPVLPGAILLILTIAATAWNWRLVAQRRTHPVPALRTSTIEISVVTAVISVGTSLLLILIANPPQLSVVAIGVTGLLVTTAAGGLWAWRTKPGKAAVREILPLRATDWVGYLAFGWLVCTVLYEVAAIALAIPLVNGAIVFIGVLTNGTDPVMPTVEGAIQQIFFDQAITGLGLAIPGFSEIGSMFASIGGVYGIFVSLLFSPIFAPLLMLASFVGYRRLRQRTLSIALVERDAHRLAAYEDLPSIAAAHRELVVAEQLEGPASAMLRSLSRLSQDVDAALQQESRYNRRLALGAVEDRLDALARELARTNESYAALFRPVASSWRQVVAAQVRELAQAVESRQEIDSPYVIGVPLSDRQEIFVGRTDVTARIEQLLLDRRRPPLLLYGQRRMGKTSLLNNLGRLLPTAIVPLFVDLQGAPSQASDHAGLLYNVARRVISSAQQQRGLTLPPLPRETLVADPFTTFDEWLDAVEQALGEHTALLLLDEFEALDSAINAGRFDEERVMGMLRNLIQHRPKFKVLLAGSHTLDEIQRWSNYLINAQLVKLDYLKEDESRKLVEQPVKDFALRYEPAASQRILDLTRGHPFLLQLLCAEVVALKNEQDPAVRRLACLEDVEAAVPEALRSGNLFFADIERNQIDADGRALLHLMTRQGEGAIVGREALALHCGERLDQTLALLTRRDLIESINGGYRFQVELIRRWFAHTEHATPMPHQEPIP